MNLPEILAAHARWLDTDGREGARADFHRKNLQGAKLAGARLAKANFRFAKLAGADFTGADLRGADLRGATLTVTTQGYNELDLPREHATANFTGAHLEGALTDRAPEASATWTVPWPVTLERLEALVRTAGGALDPQLAQVGPLMKNTDDGTDTTWLRTNAGCALTAWRSNRPGVEAWRIRAATRFGSVALAVARSGWLTVAVEGTAEQEAAVLDAVRGMLGER